MGHHRPPRGDSRADPGDLRPFDEATPLIAGTVHEGIPGSRWEVFEASSHMPHAEEPERYMAVLDGFLGQVEAARAN